MKWFKHEAMASYSDDLLLIREELGFAGLGVYWQIMEMLSLRNGRCPMQQVLLLKCRAFPERKIRRVIELATGLVVDQGGFVCMAKDEQETSKVFCSDVAPSDLAEQMGPTRTRIEENRDR